MAKTQPRIPGEDPADTQHDDADIALAAAEPVETPKPKRSGKAEPVAHAGKLPSQHDIDATKLDRAVLTDDGWLVPDKPLPKNDTLR